MIIINYVLYAVISQIYPDREEYEAHQVINNLINNEQIVIIIIIVVLSKAVL